MAMPDIEALIAALSLEEKASLCSGADFWHLKAVERLQIPHIMLADGPYGLRKQDASADHLGINESVAATCFPASVTLASTWNIDLIRQVGVALGQECNQEGIAVLLGPGANIKRTPLGGRNFEYFSEDPFLTGRLAAAWIDGVQSQGVGACLKHFAANNQETQRMVSDSIVDERNLREIYLSGFEYAVKTSQPWTVMSAYNKLNGTFMAQNRRLLNDILRQEWGFAGLVMSDWGGTNDRVAGIQAGLDLEMPSSGGVNDARIMAAVRAGDLPESALDTTVKRILELIAKTNGLAGAGLGYDPPSHHQLAREAAEQGMVLLKNDGGLLPLSATGNIAVIGAFADNPRFQGSGSSMVVPTQLDQPLSAIQDLTGSATTVKFAPGFRIEDGNEKPDQRLVNEALQLAGAADHVIVFLGLPAWYESEGFDRSHLGLPSNQLDLIDQLLAICPRTVVVLQNGGPLELPFAHQVSAILECHLGGQAGASALARVLFGHAVPGGKLTESFPLKLTDTPTFAWFPGASRQVQYRESIYVGYRYYATFNKPVAFPFGHGLSYTTFKYDGMVISDLNQSPVDDLIKASDLSPETGLHVRCDITNTGTRGGWEIAQLYISDPVSTLHRPLRELKGFAKIWLEPGQTQTVKFDLGMRSFAFWDCAGQDWLVETGRFVVQIGSSVADIRLEANINLEGSTVAIPEPTELAVYHNLAQGTGIISDSTFSRLLGLAIPAPESRRPFHIMSTLDEIRTTLIGRILYTFAKGQMAANMNPGKNPALKKMVRQMVDQTPLRSLVLFSGGKFSPDLAAGLLLCLNRHPLRAIATLVRTRRASKLG